MLQQYEAPTETKIHNERIESFFAFDISAYLFSVLYQN
jgi:hypothetical protein